jgi:hypothetical protein
MTNLEPNPYSIADTVTLSTKFTVVEGGAFIDPPTVVLYVIDPTGTITQYSYPSQIIKDGVGLYHFDIVPMISGNWWYKWQGAGSGINTTDDDAMFIVNASQMIPG